MKRELSSSLNKEVRLLKFVAKIIKRSPAAIISVVAILLYVAASIAVVAGLVPPLPPAKSGWENIYSPPSSRDFPWYILGTDFTGRPLFLALIRGTPLALFIAFLSALITVAVGVFLGLASGYIGGAIDSVISTVVGVALVIPTYLLALILVIILPPELKTNPFVLAGVMSLTSWASLARSIRSQTLTLKKREFIDVARALGFSARKIMFGEILRYMAPYVVMSLILSMTGAIYGYTGLAFLGLMPMTSDNWGVQIFAAIRAGGALFSDRAILALWSPIIVIILIQYSLINMARVMEEVLNPQLRLELLGEEE